MTSSHLHLSLSYLFVVLFPCSFPYIMKLKFGNYAMLNVLADQWKAQGSTFDPRLLMDRSLSKAKICHCLMIEKVVDRIGELDEPHLKLVVMHDFIWALVEEQASNRAHQHQVKNQDSRWDIHQVESEAHSILQDVITQALHPGRPTVCDYVKDNSCPAVGGSLWCIQGGPTSWLAGGF